VHCASSPIPPFPFSGRLRLSEIQGLTMGPYHIFWGIIGICWHQLPPPKLKLNLCRFVPWGPGHPTCCVDGRQLVEGSHQDISLGVKGFARKMGFRDSQIYKSMIAHDACQKSVWSSIMKIMKQIMKTSMRSMSHQLMYFSTPWCEVSCHAYLSWQNAKDS